MSRPAVERAFSSKASINMSQTLAMAAMSQISLSMSASVLALDMRASLRRLGQSPEAIPLRDEIVEFVDHSVGKGVKGSAWFILHHLALRAVRGQRQHCPAPRQPCGHHAGGRTADHPRPAPDADVAACAEARFRHR